MISIILPLYNELSHGYIQRYLPLYKKLSKDLPLELIVIDGDSSDGTTNYLAQLDISFHILKNSSRLARIKKGIELASGDITLLHHPRSILNKEAFLELENTPLEWGGFTHIFDSPHPLLKFTSWYSNFIRADIKNIFYLDHCIFFRAEYKQNILKISNMDIFEDTEISKALNAFAKPTRLKNNALTSSVRFIKNGFIKQAFLNQKMKLLYYLKADHKIMNQEYEKNLNLNKHDK